MADIRMQALFSAAGHAVKGGAGRGLADSLRKVGQAIGIRGGQRKEERIGQMAAATASVRPVEPDPVAPKTPVKPMRQRTASAVIGQILANQQKQHETMRQQLDELAKTSAAREPGVSIGELREVVTAGGAVLGATGARTRRLQAQSRGQDGPVAKPTNVEQSRQDSLSRLEGRSVRSDQPSASVGQAVKKARRQTPYPGKVLDGVAAAMPAARPTMTAVATAMTGQAGLKGKVVTIGGGRQSPGRMTPPAGAQVMPGVDKPAARESISELAASERGYDQRPLTRGR